jgi:hypothetical protein
MTAVDSDISPATRTRFEVLETIASVNTAVTTTVNRALSVPSWAQAATFILDITVTGTTPLFDFQIHLANSAARQGALLDSTTDKFPVPTTGAAPLSAANTQITTDTSTPINAISIGPGLTLDVTGSATANAHYSYPAFLTPWLIYTYVMDGTTADEDYAGTISVVWHPYNSK